MTDVLGKLQTIFDDIFFDEVSLTAATTADDVEEWDSIMHVTVIVAIEKEFGITFSTGEAEEAANVGELCQLIEQKIG